MKKFLFSFVILLSASLSLYALNTSASVLVLEEDFSLCGRFDKGGNSFAVQKGRLIV